MFDYSLWSPERIRARALLRHSRTSEGTLLSWFQVESAMLTHTRHRKNFCASKSTTSGNYERNTNTPSIDILLKIAKVFDVSIDYLIGEGKVSSYNKDVLKRINDIEQLDEETRSKLFFLIDNVVQNFKTKQAFS